MKFTIEQTAGNARAGSLLTPHGIIKTPNFNPVGTQATVKSLSATDLSQLGAQIVLANTYHLHLRPGEKTVEKLGGLGKFMGWNGPTMTDSGGYQVFSLGSAQQTVGSDGKKLHKFTPGAVSAQNEAFIEEARLGQRKTQPIKPAKMDEEGVTFYSHLDGSEHRLDPQIATRMQEAIGADLIVAFDDHESPLWEYEQTKASLIRTNRWGIASRNAQKRSDQLMYGVIHGGIFEDLRKDSAKFTDKHFDAIAVGGSYTSKSLLYQVLDWTLPLTTPEKPRHLLGIGEIQDMFEAIECGIDFFDCVSPTRRGRHGNLYTHVKNGGKKENAFTIQITNNEYVFDARPIDASCSCFTCQNHTRAYLHHLFKAEELLAHRLASIHNIFFIVNLVQDIRTAILHGSFSQMKKMWLA